MSFNASNLTVSIDGGTLGHPHCLDYSTSDNLSTVEGSNYFSDNRFFRFYNIVRVTANDGKALYDVVSTQPVSLRKYATVSSFEAF